MSPREPSAASGVQDELSALLDDILELAGSTTGIDRQKLEDLKQGFRERVEQFGADAQTAAKGAASSIHAQVEETLDHVDRYAHEKPWHLVLAAGLIGVAVGVLVARR